MSNLKIAFSGLSVPPVCDHGIFSYVVNILFSKLFQESPGKISALGLSCTDLAALDPHSQDLRSIFFQRAAWLIRFIKNY